MTRETANGRQTSDDLLQCDVAIYGATAGGIAAALAAARMGCDSILIERGEHLGGMVTSGLGLIDLLRKNAVGGIFREVVDKILEHYAHTWGEDSDEYRLTYDGLWCEPHVAEDILNEMLRAQKGLAVLRDYELIEVIKEKEVVVGSRYIDRKSGRTTRIMHNVAIDCTYEADLAAAAGVAYRVGREGRKEYGERFAGHIFYDWRNHRQEVLPQSTGEPSPYVQAYCFRITVSGEQRSRIPFSKPSSYTEFTPIYKRMIEDFQSGRARRLRDVIYMVNMPNGKFDSNGNIEGATGLNLAEENLRWPDGDWTTRDDVYSFYRGYSEGLWYFLQNEPVVPWIIREEARCFGLCPDEYLDNGHFPWQLYVRQGRRIIGKYVLTEHDFVPPADTGRPPIPRDTIAVCEHNFDCHPCRNRGVEGSVLTPDGFEILEGTMWFRNKMKSYNRPTSIPYRAIVPEKIDGLLVPVGLSASHVAFMALRMEPIWMALGQAAGVAASHAISTQTQVRNIDIGKLQRTLLSQGQVIVYFDNLRLDEPKSAEIQLLAVEENHPDYDVTQLMGKLRMALQFSK